MDLLVGKVLRTLTLDVVLVPLNFKLKPLISQALIPGEIHLA